MPYNQAGYEPAFGRTVTGQAGAAGVQAGYVLGKLALQECGGVGSGNFYDGKVVEPCRDKRERIHGCNTIEIGGVIETSGAIEAREGDRKSKRLKSRESFPYNMA